MLGKTDDGDGDDFCDCKPRMPFEREGMRHATERRTEGRTEGPRGGSRLSRVNKRVVARVKRPTVRASKS